MSDLMVERQSIDIPLSEVARRSGLNGALVKYHFGSKDGLLLAVLLHIAKPGLDALEALVNADMPARAKLERNIVGLINTYFRYPYINPLIKYLTRESHLPECVEITEKFIRPITRYQCEIVKQGIRSGEIDAVEPEFVYLSVVGACEALLDVRYALVYGYGITQISAEFRRRYIDYVMNLVGSGLFTKAGNEGRVSHSQGADGSPQKASVNNVMIPAKRPKKSPASA